MMPNNGHDDANDDEHERTSLLASSSAPPLRKNSIIGRSSSRATLTNDTIATITSNARRLAEGYHDDVDDGDNDDEYDDGGGNIEGDDYLAFLSARAAAFGESFESFGSASSPTSESSSSPNITATKCGMPWNKDEGNRSAGQHHHQQGKRPLTSSSSSSALMLPRPPSHPEIEPAGGSQDGDLSSSPPKKLLGRGGAAHYYSWLLQPLPARLAVTLMFALFLGAALLLTLGAYIAGPPRRPTGKYVLVESQMASSSSSSSSFASMDGGSSSRSSISDGFLKYYDFYAGKDSVGSGGYVVYVSREIAEADGLVEVVTEAVPASSMIEVYDEGDPRGVEVDWLKEDLIFLEQLKHRREKEKKNENKDENGGVANTNERENKSHYDDGNNDRSLSRQTQGVPSSISPPRLEPFNPDINNATTIPTETFIILSSQPTFAGPRNSIRLEGKRRFNRGLFIVDLRHMPSGCGTWPALWLTDEANWPVNGEIDIIEGVNYQDTAKTALHTAKECKMDDVPELSKTGSWDTAVGIPDRKTGKPDMTFRYAQNCFVYDPHQWIDQGCVATDLKLQGRSLGIPLNENGGGVYALEWDPVYHHIRTWVFSPHGQVPRNLRDALRTANNVEIETRVAPDTNLWGLPYGHFPIGKVDFTLTFLDSSYVWN